MCVGVVWIVVVRVVCKGSQVYDQRNLVRVRVTTHLVVLRREYIYMRQVVNNQYFSEYQSSNIYINDASISREREPGRMRCGFCKASLLRSNTGVCTRN